MDERHGARGSSGIYRWDETMRRWGLGALTPGMVTANIPAGALLVKPTGVVIDGEIQTLIDPLEPPAENTRIGLRAMANLYRIGVSKRAAEVRNTIFQITSQTMPQCVGTKSVLDPSVMSACEKNVSPERLLMPLGIINVLDVPLSIQDLLNVGEDGSMEQVYVPTPQQRFIAAYHAYIMSQWHIARILDNRDDKSTSWDARAAYVGDESVAADMSKDGYVFESEADRNKYGMLGIIALTRGPNKSLSIEEFLSGMPFLTAARKSINLPDGVFTTKWDGFPLNPIAPLRSELKEAGGLYRYYLRGGFLLYKPCLQGTTNGWIFKQELRYTSGYFMCPDGKLGAATEKIPDEGKGWIVSVGFAPGQWKIHMQMADRSSWQAIKKGIADAVMKTLGMLCKLQPMANLVAQAAVSSRTCTRQFVTPQQKAAVCGIDANAMQGTPQFEACQAKLKKCTEGEQGCVCQPPNPSTYMQQQAMIAAGNALLSATCAAIAPNAPIPCPPPPPGAGGVPWWVIAGGAAVVGAFLYSRNRTPAT